MGLRVYQSLWATELRRPGAPERPIAERFDRVRAAGFDGMAIDLGAMDIVAARALVPEFGRTGLRGLLTAFPRSIEELRPALHLAKDIGSPFVIVVGQVMPLAVADMAEAIKAWMAIADQEGVPIQFETHRNCITNDLFSTLLLLDAIPDMRLSADLSHYVVDREMMQPISRGLSDLRRPHPGALRFLSRQGGEPLPGATAAAFPAASHLDRHVPGLVASRLRVVAAPRHAGTKTAFSCASSDRATMRSPTPTERNCRIAGARLSS